MNENDKKFMKAIGLITKNLVKIVETQDTLGKHDIELIELISELSDRMLKRVKKLEKGVEFNQTQNQLLLLTLAKMLKVDAAELAKNFAEASIAQHKGDTDHEMYPFVEEFAEAGCQAVEESDDLDDDEDDDDDDCDGDCENCNDLPDEIKELIEGITKKAKKQGRKVIMKTVTIKK